eukprot:Gregarina_sp_Poly_1__9255@NODE_571_length_7485_cov_357_460367_g448_i0_p6_GENE_NODE_571_length_7485_cov_357_460367_g448_i0NODE_571_length_7485_cov_357_460367_g448_i0_p6_ORF_typecomplete_len151_score28_52PI_PP_I/PF18363_1/0_12_NODE_571_length_7485_cov_357_460367_g448_i069987450
MVDFGAIFDKVRGKDEKEEKSNVPFYILPMLPPWFQNLPVSQQNLIWSLAKGYLSSSSKEEASSGLDFGSILGGVMGRSGGGDEPLMSRARGLTATPGATPDHEQQCWATVVAAAKAEDGPVDLNEWPFNDPVHGQECCSIANKCASSRC